MDLKLLQDKLNATKSGLASLDKDIHILKMEKDYQELISKYSSAYLSGSDWYVGPSLREHLVKSKLQPNIMVPLYILSNELYKNKNNIK